MIAKYPLIAPDACDEIVAELREMSWLPGETPNDAYAQKVKKNLEIPMGTYNEADEHMKWFIQCLMNCQPFTRRTLPKHLARPRFNLCRDGGEYGFHADSAFMGSNPEIRTDVSMTLWLTEPDSYEGGELVLSYVSGHQMELKEPAGTVVFYPSGVNHRVKPVTSGERICFIAWVESHIQDPQKRDVLAEITGLCDDMAKVDELGDIHTRMLGIKHNLYRQWMGKA